MAFLIAESTYNGKILINVNSIEVVKVEAREIILSDGWTIDVDEETITGLIKALMNDTKEGTPDGHN